MPWQVLTSPVEQWGVLPSFLIAEVLFIAMAGVALFHAKKAGRAELMIWAGALIGGTANDLIFMALPLVDNFWHSQATIMLSPRLPLYIPCVYICFLYYPTIAVRRLKMSGLAVGALTGLVAIIFYAPFDITGAKLVWWTWHDTDLPVASRILGAPTSSTLWVLTFAGSFAWLIDRMLARDPEVSWATFAKGLALVAGLTTILMVLQITVLQQLDGGAPAYIALGTGVALYVVVFIWRGRGSIDRLTPDPADRPAHVAVLVYAATLVLCMAAFDPASHVSSGAHQEAGECYVDAQDITGLTRHRYLCVEDFEEDFTFACTEPPADGARWYTICGRAHTSFVAWMSGVAVLGVFIAGLFTFLFGFGPAPKPQKRSRGT